MEVSRLMNVTMEEMDQFISQMVIKDIEEATNKTVTEKDIHSGYSYVKKLTGRSGVEGRVKTTIRELSSGKYHVTFKSNQGVNHLSYTYFPEEDGSVNLTYSETYDADSKSKDVNYNLMNFLYKRSNKKRINKILSNIEYLIQENRK